MPGYAFVVAECAACKKMICCNPNRVPSIRINNKGSKQPICRECAELWKTVHNQPDFQIPEDAYEAIPEEELR
jgi:hypothetical protein